MCLLITAFAAIISAVLWYAHAGRDVWLFKVLTAIFGGAALMWCVDAAVEFAELKEEFFQQPVADLINDAVLGLCVVAIGLVAWLVVLLIKDPQGALKRKK